MTVAFDACVLTGGASTRMGSDKALLLVDGVPMAVRVADALHGAGAASVVTIGGDLDALITLGLFAVSDSSPGEGPLGGVLDALTLAGSSDIVVIAACDLPSLTADAVIALVDAISDADVAVASVAGERQPILAAWRRSTATSVVQAAFTDGERSPRRVLQTLNVIDVELADPRWALDVDTPDDL